MLALGIIGLCSLRMIRVRVLSVGSESSLIVLPIVFDLGDYWLLQRCNELYLETNKYKRIYRLLVHGLSSFYPFEFTHLLTISNALKNQYTEIGFPNSHISVIPRGFPERNILS